MNVFLLISAVALTLHIKQVPTDKPSFMGACSAVLIQEDLALSAAHCFGRNTKAAWAKDNEGKSYTVTYLYKDPLKDLILLRVKEKQGSWAKLGSMPAKTDEVFIVSNADDMDGTHTKGMVTNHIYMDFQHLIVHSAMILKGSSGSGLFDAKGRLVGINTMLIGPFTFAVDIDEIREFLDEARDRGRI